MILQTCDCDLSSEIDQIPQSEPYIVVTGKPGMDRTQYFVCVEKALLTESKSIRDALLDVICVYYVFDISYPQSVAGLFLFLQQNVFKIKDSQKAPPCLSKLLRNIGAL